MQWTNWNGLAMRCHRIPWGSQLRQPQQRPPPPPLTMTMMMMKSNVYYLFDLISSSTRTLTNCVNCRLVNHVTKWRDGMRNELFWSNVETDFEWRKESISCIDFFNLPQSTDSSRGSLHCQQLLMQCGRIVLVRCRFIGWLNQEEMQTHKLILTIWIELICFGCKLLSYDG